MMSSRTRRKDGAKSGVGRLDRMKRGSGMKGREDKSSGVEILMADAFAFEELRRRGAVSRSSISRPRRRLRHTFAQSTARDAAVHWSRGRLYARFFPVLCAALLSAIEANDVALGGIRAHRKEGQACFKSMPCESFWCGDKKRTTVASARTDESSISSVPSPPPLADALHLQEALGSLQSKLRAGFVSGIVQVLFLIYCNILWHTIACNPSPVCCVY